MTTYSHDAGIAVPFLDTDFYLETAVIWGRMTQRHVELVGFDVVEHRILMASLCDSMQDNDTNI